MYKDRLKVLLRLLLILALIQLIRAAAEYAAFSLLGREETVDYAVRTCTLMILTAAGLIIARKNNIELSVFPQKRLWLYGIFTVITLGLMASGLFFGRITVMSILTLFYGCIITPVFEELLFRGFVWRELSSAFSKQWQVYLICAALFALWHFGYADTIAARTNGNLGFILVNKALIGLVYGLIVGFARWKTGNCFSSMLLHAAMNVFGR